MNALPLILSKWKASIAVIDDSTTVHRLHSSVLKYILKKLSFLRLKVILILLKYIYCIP